MGWLVKETFNPPPCSVVRLPTIVTLMKVGLQPSNTRPPPGPSPELSAIKAFLMVPSAW